MWQRFGVDRLRHFPYLAVAVAACASGPPPSLAPSGAAPISRERVQAFVDSTQPRGHRLSRFKWSFKDEHSSTGGRGSARVAGPDSMRIDIAGPLGVGRAAAFVLGDSEVWVNPEKSVKDMVPNYPLLWAMFAVALGPSDTDALNGLVDSQQVFVQYANGADTVEYLWQTHAAPTRFYAVVRHAGKLVGRVETRLDAEGHLASSRLTVPRRPARLDLNFYLNTDQGDFPPDTWRRREP
jgi:hypothetical protein